MREYRKRKKLAKKILLKQRSDQDLDAIGSTSSSQVNQRAGPSTINSISAEQTRRGNSQSQQQIETSEHTREYSERKNDNINIESNNPSEKEEQSDLRDSTLTLKYDDFTKHKKAHENFDGKFRNNPFGYSCPVCNRLWLNNDLNQASDNYEDLSKKRMVLSADSRTMQVQALPAQLECAAPMNQRRPSLRGSAFDCAPLIVTAGSSLNLQTKTPDPMPELSPFITDIKSEWHPVEMKEDPQSEDAASLDEEDQLSDADQPCEDLIPLSNDQVPLTNAQDPLTEVKVEETLNETKVKVEEVEVTDPQVPVTWSGVPTVQVPLLERQVLRSANDNADLICTQSQQIAKLTARCNHTQRQLNSMTQLLSRRDNTIRCLRAERDQLAGCRAGGRGIQILSVNNTVEEKKPNRKLFVVKHIRKPFVKTQATTSLVTRTSRIQNSSENGQKTSVHHRLHRENSYTGVKRSLNIVERSSLGIQYKSSTLNKFSVYNIRTSNLRKPSIAVKPIPDKVKSPTLVIQPKSDSLEVSSVGAQRKSVNRQKPSITIKPISEIIKSPLVQPELDNRQVSFVRIQPKPDVRPMCPVGLQRTSDIPQNSLVIQIDGMHKTVLQPTLVRLDNRDVS